MLVGWVVVGWVVVGSVVVGPVVVGAVGLEVVVGSVVVGEVVVGDVVVGIDGDRGLAGFCWAPPPSTREPRVVPLLEPAPVSSAADRPTRASNPVSTPKPRASVAAQLTTTVGQLTARRPSGSRRTGSLVAAVSSIVSGPSDRSRSGRTRVARTGNVSRITC